jgi:heme-degrading monooxygenase HmoA
MIAVIFEVELAEGCNDEYLSVAANIRPQLEKIDGFISVERFQSLVNPQKLVSLSFFRDEEAVMQWRKVMDHKDAQQRGRNGIFKDYRLRVANVVRDYGMFDRQEAPAPVAAERKS